MQLDGIYLPLGPAFIQVGLVGVELAGPGLTPPGQQLFGDCCALVVQGPNCGDGRGGTGGGQEVRRRRRTYATVTTVSSGPHNRSGR